MAALPANYRQGDDRTVEITTEGPPWNGLLGLTLSYWIQTLALGFCSGSKHWGEGLEVRWCWVNFQCHGVLLIWLVVGQGPTALAVGADGGCFDIFTLIYLFSPLSASFCETARYKLKYCLKVPLNPKQTFTYQNIWSARRFPNP